MALKDAGMPESAIAGCGRSRPRAPSSGSSRSPSATRRRWIAAAAVALVVAPSSGSARPSSPERCHAPGVNLFPCPRIVPMATFPLALLAGLGLDVARRRRRP
jgi:hypothetical protein